MSLKLKGKVGYKQHVYRWSSIIHENETWATNERTTWYSERWDGRADSGQYRWEKRTNISDELRCRDSACTICYMLRWIGHVLRKYENKITGREEWWTLVKTVETLEGSRPRDASCTEWRNVWCTAVWYKARWLRQSRGALKSLYNT